MAATYKAAAKLLEVAVKCLPRESQGWGTAMRRELDFIETDQDLELLRWAVGGVMALCAYSARLQLRAGFEKALGSLRKPEARKSIEGMFSGLGIATALLAVFVLGYIGLSNLRPQYGRLMDTLLIFLFPEAAYMLAVSLLWKHRRAAAFGVLIGAAILFTHVVIHHVTRG